jgi:hypothetical protein
MDTLCFYLRAYTTRRPLSLFLLLWRTQISYTYTGLILHQPNKPLQWLKTTTQYSSHFTQATVDSKRPLRWKSEPLKFSPIKQTGMLQQSQWRHDAPCPIAVTRALGNFCSSASRWRQAHARRLVASTLSLHPQVAAAKYLSENWPRLEYQT